MSDLFAWVYDGLYFIVSVLGPWEHLRTHLRAGLSGISGTVEGHGKLESHPHPPPAEPKPILLCLWIMGKILATSVPLPGQGTACHQHMNNPRWGWKKHRVRLLINEKQTVLWAAAELNMVSYIARAYWNMHACWNFWALRWAKREQTVVKFLKIMLVHRAKWGGKQEKIWVTRGCLHFLTSFTQRESRLSHDSRKFQSLEPGAHGSEAVTSRRAWVWGAPSSTMTASQSHGAQCLGTTFPGCGTSKRFLERFTPAKGRQNS